MKSIRVIIIGLFLILLIFVAGCSIGGVTDPRDKTSSEPGKYFLPEDYGNGILYFPCVQADFGNSLSNYMTGHPDLKVVSIAPNDYTGHGYTTGYFVIVEKTVNE